MLCRFQISIQKCRILVSRGRLIEKIYVVCFICFVCVSPFGYYIAFLKLDVGAYKFVYIRVCPQIVICLFCFGRGPHSCFLIRPSHPLASPPPPSPRPVCPASSISSQNSWPKTKRLVQGSSNSFSMFTIAPAVNEKVSPPPPQIFG